MKVRCFDVFLFDFKNDTNGNLTSRMAVYDQGQKHPRFVPSRRVQTGHRADRCGAVYGLLVKDNAFDRSLVADVRYDVVREVENTFMQVTVQVTLL